jgi:hypothetical protein
VTVGLTGCRIVANGRLTRIALAGAGPPLIRELGALAR